MLNNFSGRIEAIMDADILPDGSRWDVLENRFINPFDDIYKGIQNAKRKSLEEGYVQYKEEEEMVGIRRNGSIEPLIYNHLTVDMIKRLEGMRENDDNLYIQKINRLDYLFNTGDFNRDSVKRLLDIDEEEVHFSKRHTLGLEDLNNVTLSPSDILMNAIEDKFPEIRPSAIVPPGISMEFIPSKNDEELLASYDQGCTGKSEDMEPTPQQTDHMRHEDITTELYMIFDEKDSKYGKSFEQSVTDFGLVSAVIRMSDKMNRLKNIVMDEIDMGDNDESTRDTLLDLANYAILSVMQLDKWNEE